MNLLAAVRCGRCSRSCWRTVATLDHMLEGRLTINISAPISRSDRGQRVQVSAVAPVVEILKQAWTRDEITYHGEIYDFDGVPSDPARPYQQNGGPLLYFGGYSPAAVELCAQHCDVYLMWPETREDLTARMKTVNERAEVHGRTLDYGLRVHMIVRDTEAEAREYAQKLVSKLDDDAGREIRERALDSGSLGVARQARNRDLADMDGFIEPHLWTGVGRPPGCGGACRFGDQIGRNRGLSEDGHAEFNFFRLSASR